MAMSTYQRLDGSLGKEKFTHKFTNMIITLINKLKCTSSFLISGTFFLTNVLKFYIEQANNSGLYTREYFNESKHLNGGIARQNNQTDKHTKCATEHRIYLEAEIRFDTKILRFELKLKIRQSANYG